MLLQDKVVLVTGGTRGIGLGISQKLASQGAKVVVSATKQEVCDQVAADLSKTYNVDTLGVQCNVANFDSVQALIKKVMETFGRIDVLVNNAGITRDNLILRLNEDDWNAVIQTNLNSVFYCTKSAIRPMLKQKSGRIINISSVVGIIGNPGQSNYAASKAGIIGFTKSIAKEFGAKGITCNAVAPGFIQTDMIETLPGGSIDNIIETVPLKRLGTVDDIANAVLYLSSDMANYVTGEVIAVDGGINM